MFRMPCLHRRRMHRMSADIRRANGLQGLDLEIFWVPKTNHSTLNICANICYYYSTIQLSEALFARDHAAHTRRARRFGHGSLLACPLRSCFRCTVRQEQRRSRCRGEDGIASARGARFLGYISIKIIGLLIGIYAAGSIATIPPSILSPSMWANADASTFKVRGSR